MPYLPVKDLPIHFEASLKTIYNYLSKGKSKIRTQKRDGKTFVHFEDFKAFYNSSKTSFSPESENSFKSIEKQPIEPLKEELQILQSALQEAESNVTDLSKYNSNLQDQLSKYGLLLTEEKNERKEVSSKLHNTIEAFGQERLHQTKRYFTLAAVTTFLDSGF